jgi:hypothetical protein
MAELSVCRRVCQCDCEGGGDVTSLVRGGETATSAQVISENLMGGVPMQAWGPRVCGGASHSEKTRGEARDLARALRFVRLFDGSDSRPATLGPPVTGAGSGRAGTRQARVIPQLRPCLVPKSENFSVL